MSVRTSQDTASLVAGLYLADPDPSFRRVLDSTGAQSDYELADAIEADARERLHRSLPNSLARYLDAIPGLTGLRIALDAAIEFAIRAAVHSGTAEADAVRALAAAHPNLREAIETAFALSEGLASTTTLARSAGRPVALKVPCEYGPRFPDGGRRFDVRQRLGVGSQGEVYLAADRQLSESDRPAWVAIKRMRPMINADAASQAAAEARKARRISHPNVVRVFDRATDDAGMDYIVYEHIDDGDMAQWFAKRTEPLPAHDAAALIASIARGVHAAHLAGVVHCDLKPSNVLLTRDGTPKVADFGVAAAIRSDSGRIPDATPVGNLAFTAPEQYRGEDGAQAIPADVYALGGLLYFVLTGKQPNGDTPAHVASRHMHPDTPAPSPRALRPEIDLDLDAICRRALAPKAADRYASAHALAEDLDAWLASRPIEWRNPSRARRLSLLLRRQPSLIAAGTLLLTAVIGGTSATVYFAMRGREQVAHERYLAVQRLQQEQERSLNGLKQNLNSVLRVLEFQSKGNFSLDWLPQLTILESAVGPLLFGEAVPETAVNVWAARIRNVKNVVENAERSGHGSDFEMVLWRDALAFWALRAGDFAAAGQALDSNDAHWDRLLSPEDEWRLLRTGLRACETIQRHAATARGGQENPERRREVAQAAETLRELIDTMYEVPNRRAMRVLFLVNLRLAYGADLLNQPKDAAEIRRRLIQGENVGATNTEVPPPPNTPDATR
jgi:serine/threonine protein kinase